MARTARGTPPTSSNDLSLTLIRRRNTCEIIQDITAGFKYKDGPSGLVLSAVRSEDYRPLRREVELEKPTNDDFGVELISYNGGLFVCCVHRDSPAFRSGLQFGDQLLSINEEDLTDVSVSVAKAMLRSLEQIVINACDSPLTRTFFLHRAHIKEKWGFSFTEKEIISVASNSPAAAARLPVSGTIVEVLGCNVLLWSPRRVAKLLAQPTAIDPDVDPNVLQVTVMEKEAAQYFRAYLAAIVSSYGLSEIDCDSIANTPVSSPMNGRQVQPNATSISSLLRP